MLLLNEEIVASLLPLRDVFTAVKDGFAAQARGEISMPLRTLAAKTGGVLGAMPAAFTDANGAIGAKLVTVFAGNAALELPTHNALVALFDPQTGVPKAVMDGRYITEVRTAVVSALATSALARADAHTLAILGTGVQARAHIDALVLVMKVDELRVWGRTPKHSAELAAFARERGLNARTADTVAQATLGARVVCTVTSSREPIVSAKDIGTGTHVNAVGFGGPTVRELSSDLVSAARVFVDSLDGAERESGNLILARRDEGVSARPKVTLLCDVLTGRSPGRQHPDDITLFDSLGIAIEDVACAQLAYARAIEAGVGTRVEF
jgi:alanine dehydrogenase